MFSFLTARLQEVLLDHPELEVVRVLQGAHLVNTVELPCPVVVEDAVEGARVSVHVELVVLQAVHVHVLDDLLVSLGSVQLPEPRQDTRLKTFPHDLNCLVIKITGHFSNYDKNNYHFLLFCVNRTEIDSKSFKLFEDSITSNLDPPMLMVTFGFSALYRSMSAAVGGFECLGFLGKLGKAFSTCCNV